jgi:Mn2+/Fe2+ NRAMP family transporter
MGNYTNKFWSNFFGILAFLVIVAADIALIAQWIK